MMDKIFQFLNYIGLSVGPDSSPFLLICLGILLIAFVSLANFINIILVYSFYIFKLINFKILKNLYIYYNIYIYNYNIINLNLIFF